MALSAHLLLRQNQSLVMTPQLMQSIRLLQMTHLELMQFIAQEMEKNPLLDFVHEPDAEAFLNADDNASPASSHSDEENAHEDPALPPSDWYHHDAGHHSLENELDVNFSAFVDDSEPSDHVSASSPILRQNGGRDASDSYNLEDFLESRPSLRDHVSQQISFAVMDIGERLIAQELMDHLDDAGYVHVDCAELAQRLSVGRGIIEKVLAKLQTFDPPGIFARSLQECLLIQLRQKGRSDPAMEVLLAHLDLLGRRDFVALKRLCGVQQDDLLLMLDEIRQLNPKPGLAFEVCVSETIVPDVIVTPLDENGWQVDINAETLPKVLVNQSYFAQVSAHSQDHPFLSECLNNANWLIRSLDQRTKTIVKVASEIVRQQGAFLANGVGQMRPLTLKTVADAIGMHESTVSRVTTNKYMLTPRGLFELKYFFTASINAMGNGDHHSAEAVRHKIKSLISHENIEAILSDDDLVELLKKSGIDIARRTVAKYREAMNIPSSVQRRREKRAFARVSGF